MEFEYQFIPIFNNCQTWVFIAKHRDVKRHIFYTFNKYHVFNICIYVYAENFLLSTHLFILTTNADTSARIFFPIKFLASFALITSCPSMLRMTSPELLAKKQVKNTRQMYYITKQQRACLADFESTICSS